MLLYYAGCDSAYAAKKLIAGGGENALASAFYLGYKRPPTTQFKRFVLDSGGYTLRLKGETVDPRVLGEYINRFDVGLAFNMDTLDFEESMANQHVLEEMCPRTYVIPVYHYADWATARWRDGLKRLADEYPFVSVAGLGAPNSVERARFYSFCFNVVRDRIRIHGLGATAIDHMLQFPFYSVDSTAWINAHRFGDWVEHVDGRIIKHKSLYVQSRMPARVKEVPNPNLHAYDTDRFLTQAVKTYNAFAEHVTRLWTQRGVTWNDFDCRRPQ